MKTLLASLLLSLSLSCQAVEKVDIEIANQTLGIYVSALEYNLKNYQEGKTSKHDFETTNTELMYEARKAASKVKYLLKMAKIERGMM